MKLQTVFQVVCIFCYMSSTVICELHFSYGDSVFSIGRFVEYIKPQIVSRADDFEMKLDRIIDLLTTGPGMCSKDVSNVTQPTSCADLRHAGVTCDGTYDIYLEDSSEPTSVRCDMTTNGGGWTVLMRRSHHGYNRANFHQNWTSYKDGFGSPDKEFWIGNEIIHKLSTAKNNKLRIQLSTFDGNTKILEYSSFSVGDESSSYELEVGQLTYGSIIALSKAPLLGFNARLIFNPLVSGITAPFSTFDRHNSERVDRCTILGGWWFHNCNDAFLTGIYGRDYVDLGEGVWSDSNGQMSMKEAKMMIRSYDFVVK